MDAFLHPGPGAEAADRVAVATRCGGGWDERATASWLIEPGGSWLATLLGILRCGAVAVPVGRGGQKCLRAFYDAGVLEEGT